MGEEYERRITRMEMGLIAPDSVATLVPISIQNRFKFVDRYYCSSIDTSKNDFYMPYIAAELDIPENDERHMTNALYFGFIRTFRTGIEFNKEDAHWIFCALQYIRCKSIGYHDEDPHGRTFVRLSQCNLKNKGLSYILKDIEKREFRLEKSIPKWIKKLNLKSNYEQTIFGLCQRTIDKEPSL